MLRTSWIVILAVFAIAVFVSKVSSATSKTTSTLITTLSHPANTSDSAAATTESVASTAAHNEKNETAPHVGNSSELSNNKRVSGNNETVTSSENERNEKGCHMKEEAKDMLNCFVVTNDVASPELTTNPLQDNETNKTKQEISKFNDTYPPKIFPDDKNVKTIDEVDEATRRRLNHTFYATFTPAEIEAALSPIAQKSTNDEEKFQGSQGTIMLTMVLTLAIAIAAIYLGIIAWKRYLEYRYNHQYLLDNDSEFDANDLHHFEL